MLKFVHFCNQMRTILRDNFEARRALCAARDNDAMTFLYSESYVIAGSITSAYKWDNFDLLRGLVCALYLRNCCKCSQIALSFLLKLTSPHSAATVPPRSEVRVLAASRSGEL